MLHACRVALVRLPAAQPAAAAAPSSGGGSGWSGDTTLLPGGWFGGAAVEAGARASGLPCSYCGPACVLRKRPTRLPPPPLSRGVAVARLTAGWRAAWAAGAAALEACRASTLRLLVASHGGSLTAAVDDHTTHLVVLPAQGAPPTPADLAQLATAVGEQCGGAAALAALRRRLQAGRLVLVVPRWVKSRGTEKGVVHACVRRACAARCTSTLPAAAHDGRERDGPALALHASHAPLPTCLALRSLPMQPAAG